MTDTGETLQVPHPMNCTTGELREARDAYKVDLLREFGEGRTLSIEVVETLAYIAYRRQGLGKLEARKAAAQATPAALDLDEPSIETDEDGSPNAKSSVAS